MSKGKQRRLAFFPLGVIIALVLYASNAPAQQLGSIGKLLQPGQLQANPVLSHRIATEAGITITTETGDPLRTETDTP